MTPPKRPRGRPPHPDVLTPGEWRITHAVQHGLSNRQIAALKGIGLNAVKYHLSQVLGKLQLPNRQALRHWFAAPADSALRGRDTEKAANNIVKETGVGMTALETSGALGPISQIARSVRDIKVSESWYAQVLRLKHLYTFGTLAFFDCGGTRLMLTQNASKTTESLLYFKVADISQAHQALKSRGVEFTSAPHLIHTHGDGTEEWMAFLKDPDGQLLAIHSQVESGAPEAGAAAGEGSAQAR